MKEQAVNLNDGICSTYRVIRLIWVFSIHKAYQNQGTEKMFEIGQLNLTGSRLIEVQLHFKKSSLVAIQSIKKLTSSVNLLHFNIKRILMETYLGMF